MSDNRHHLLRHLTIYYLPSVVFKSFLTGFIFFIFPTALLVTLTINIMLLYVYNAINILGILFILEVIITYFSSKIFISTLKNYGDHVCDLNYENIHAITTIVVSVIILIIIIIVNYLII